ncbi:hypothetical protein A0R60_3751 [Enterobacter asburiae]|nr:hypothetical protein A0R60_3751 [Enterobacter asburiae]
MVIRTYKLKNIKYPHYYTQLHFIFIPLPLLPIRGIYRLMGI